MKFMKINHRQGLQKDQLVEIVQKSFDKIPFNAKEVQASFICKANMSKKNVDKEGSGSNHQTDLPSSDKK